MGNVHAASGQSTFSSGPPPPPPLTAPPPTSVETSDKILPTPPLENPGTFEELHKKCKGMAQLKTCPLICSKNGYKSQPQLRTLLLSSS